MTALESIQFVYAILDEAHRSHYVTTQFVCDMLTKAQLTLIRQAEQTNDERLLRPLIQRPRTVAYGGLLDRCMVVRAVRLNVTADRSVSAIELPYDEWLSREPIGVGALGVGSVQQAAYTLYNSNANEDGVRIYFAGFAGASGSTLTAQVQYVRRPNDVSYTNTTTFTGLTIPREYHQKACVLAAHFVTISDIPEQSRAQIEQFADIPAPQERLPEESTNDRINRELQAKQLQQ